MVIGFAGCQAPVNGESSGWEVQRDVQIAFRMRRSLADGEPGANAEHLQGPLEMFCAPCFIRGRPKSDQLFSKAPEIRSHTETS